MRWLALLCLPLSCIKVMAASVPTPKVTGPIPVTAKPGDPSHNYPFFSTAQWMDAYGYVEEEFYVEGLATRYPPQGPQATRKAAEDGPYRYKTRVVVHRPKSAGKFNGTVILERVHANLNQESDWNWSHEHLMRRGFVHVAATVGAAGVESDRGLKKWNLARYGSLDLNGNGRLSVEDSRQLTFDIYSQIAQIVKHPEGVKLLGDLKVKNIIATGHSESAAGLAAYYNGVHPLAGIIDGFVLHGGGGRIREDLKTPVFKLLTEFEMGQPPQPDSLYYRMWQIAGAAHADADLLAVLDALYARDLLDNSTEQCERPPLSRIPAHLVQDSVYDWMKAWIEHGKQPPRAPAIHLASVGTGKANPSVPARDENGNALGGIRLAQFAVPTATDTAQNSGAQYCDIYGSHEPFDSAKLARLYPSRARYIAEVERITDANLKAGYITKEGAESTKREAAQSKIGSSGAR